MIYYFPSCRYSAYFPAVNEEISRLLGERAILPLGCCKADYSKPRKEDTVITVCTNCALILKEVCKARVVSLFQIIDEDRDFVFPDLSKEHFVIQHCAKADDELKRSVCRVVEKTKASFVLSRCEDTCGVNLMRPISAVNKKIAPRTFSALEKKVVLLDERQQQQKLDEIIAAYEYPQVITYCNSCYEALRRKGVRVFHLTELLFAPK